MYSNGKFKRGDYVLRVDGENFKSGEKMKYIYSIPDNDSVQVAELNGTWRNEDVRHATEEELYWMKTLERDYVGDFRYTDVFIDNNGEAHLLRGIHPSDGYADVEDAKSWHEHGHFKGLYRAESFTPYTRKGE